MGILDSLSEEVEGNMKIALLLALAFVAAARAVPAGKSKTAAAALGVGVEQLNNLLNNLGDSETCNAAGCCLWNDWQSRDQQSRIQRTYNRCRYSKQMRTSASQMVGITVTTVLQPVKALGIVWTKQGKNMFFES